MRSRARNKRGGSEHAQRAPALWRRKGAVECHQIVFRQLDVESPAVLAHMRSVRCFRDHDCPLLAQEPGERDLRWCFTPAPGDLGEPPVPEHAALTERSVGHYSDAVLAAPGYEVPLRATAAEIIEHL